MSVSVYKTFAAGEVLSAADLNASLTQFTNNGTDVAFPLTKNGAAGGFKLTGLGAGAADGDSVRFEQLPFHVCNFRLTLTSGTPVTTTDVTAAETLYCAPIGGNAIGLYDGTNWHVRTSIEFSIDVPDATGVYDVFCYDNGGTPTLELTAWTNDTTRATALTTQNGVLVKTGALTRRYLGTFYSTTAGNGQIQDAVGARYLWNYYNRRLRQMYVIEATASWAYTSGTFQQANNSTANQLNFVIGVSEDIVSARVSAINSNDGAQIATWVGIGLDALTLATGCVTSMVANDASSYNNPAAALNTFPGVGKHYLAWLEASTASGTTTWVGTTGDRKSGIYGEIWA